MTALDLAKLFDEMLWCIDAFDDIMDMERDRDRHLEPLTETYLKRIESCRGRIEGALSIAMKAAEREVT